MANKEHSRKPLERFSGIGTIVYDVSAMKQKRRRPDNMRRELLGGHQFGVTYGGGSGNDEGPGEGGASGRKEGA
ncbi:hypothetical protein NDU88_003121 [Pleurodeles waltl]|uniref:Uncharacterized protein n=1 Tax=Pleurodeles waltl TaxID=8319 RepID=A0AAV7VGA6_PLEWA|nr:hypothetical protein NDU88_003121 [Pleurodeles waltl]